MMLETAKNGPASASSAIFANKKKVSGKTSRVISGASIREPGVKNLLVLRQ
jgi:hypothetical protein